MKILILEDNSERIKHFLKKFQSRATVLYTDLADKAIEYMKEHDFDMIFLDHDLGGMQMEWEENNCGMTVVDWIVDNLKTIKEPKIVIHSFNAPRSKIMLEKLQNAGFYSSNYIPGYWLT